MVGLRPGCGRCADSNASAQRTIAAGHAFVQNVRRGHYAITAGLRVHDRVRDAFEKLALSV
jgi:hypothetical protein